ncbi:Aste57867_21996 [Aphanomyces stellatus]|uniref:Aste57867_21996 protein n=1 Tax=Aphanomyces stellatus TaxID=120398 RepID=A0A485LKD4_9STRA|nr:hypothetical protein As57867_021927 [Aphanomyces stellatus]VFT98664.1 Aste57867_21996 [Aphanomyces stellatus]
MSVQPVACPKPPEIEGYLFKMKRKSATGINFTGNWNKRWFFVDTKRKEFGYSSSSTPPLTMKSSIFLDDITAVVSFDDYCFQVETKTRKFFLKGESKAGASVWVKTLDTYHKQFIAYEKYVASTPLRPVPSSEAKGTSSNNAPSRSQAKDHHLAKDATRASRKSNQRSESKDSYGSERKAKESKHSGGADHLTPVQAWSMDDHDDSELEDSTME